MDKDYAVDMPLVNGKMERKARQLYSKGGFRAWSLALEITLIPYFDILAKVRSVVAVGPHNTAMNL